MHIAAMILGILGGLSLLTVSFLGYSLGAVGESTALQVYSIIYDETSRRFKVTDLGSRNGTFTLPDEKKLVANQEVLCRPGQIIRLGCDNAFELTVK